MARTQRTAGKAGWGTERGMTRRAGRATAWVFLAFLMLPLVIAHPPAPPSPPPLDVPGNFRVDWIAGNSVILAWDAVPGAQGYFLYRGRDFENPYAPPEEWEVEGPLTELGFYDGNILSDVDHHVFYRVTAWDGENESPPSVPIGVDRFEPADPPSFTLSHVTLRHAPDNTPDTRTTVGIGEHVVFTVDNFVDLDYDRGTGQYVNDVLNQTPGVLSSHTILTPDAGWIVNHTISSVTIYFQRLTGETDVSVLVYADDQGGYANDFPTGKIENFHVVTPSGMQPVNVLGLVDPYNTYTQDPDGQLIGTFRYFLMRVLPANVNFDGLTVRENLPPFTVRWPSGNETPLADGPRPPFPLEMGNMLADSSGIAPPVSRSWLLNSYFSYSISAPSEYQSETNGYLAFTYFTTNLHIHAYSSLGVAAVSINGLWGPGDGPWE